MIWSVDTAAGRVSVREQIEPDDEPGLLALFAACDDWFEAMTGGPSAPGDVQSLFYALPAGSTIDDKRLFTVRHDDTIVGVVDAVAGHPHRDACAVGMFVIHPAYRRMGVGAAVAGALCDEARALGIREVTATVADAWPLGTAFLTSLGFAVEDASTPPAQMNRVVASGEAQTRRATLTL